MSGLGNTCAFGSTSGNSQDEDGQQGNLNSSDHEGLPNLLERWRQQSKYDMYMEKALNLWENFTAGSLTNQKRRERVKQ